MPLPLTVEGRATLWADLHAKLASLANRVTADEQPRILAAVHERVPMPTLDDRTTDQRATIEQRATVIAGLRDLHAGDAAGYRALAAMATRKANEAQSLVDALGQDLTAEHARLAALDAGQPVEPADRLDLLAILKANGMTAADIARARWLHNAVPEAWLDEFVRADVESRPRATLAHYKVLLRRLVQARLDAGQTMDQVDAEWRAALAAEGRSVEDDATDDDADTTS